MCLNESSEAMQSKMPTETVLNALRNVTDPEVGVNIVDLGLIYGVAFRITSCISI
jgi:metal-sulfur cluster biosynthetic enzyme